MKTLRILGIRGIPAAHGGFETFAEHLALFLRDRGWRVVVYCQEDQAGETFVDTWQGIERVHICAPGSGAASTVVFDAKAVRHAASHHDLCLTLGYATALFNVILRIKGIPNIINMDGIEWSRAKWGRIAKTWLWMNDWMGCWVGHHLIADHPAIKTHLMTRVRNDKITMIPYGAPRVLSASTTPIEQLHLTPGKFLTVIARPEPENSILDIVTAFSAKRRGYQLLVLGNYVDDHPYHQAVKAAASDEVVFPGAIYDAEVVKALRFHSVAYIHGHQVGGTNPSLVEALGAGNAIIAHDNRFNRWVAGEGACYFDSPATLQTLLDTVLSNADQLAAMQQASVHRFENGLTWPQVLSTYEALLEQFLPEGRHPTGR
jgi:glycosyltransferase involved in cell wall biosynthesis